jgi:hypothetical protein
MADDDAMRRIVVLTTAFALVMLAAAGCKTSSSANASASRATTTSATTTSATTGTASQQGQDRPCPTPGNNPKFIAIMVQGIGSYVQSNPADENSGGLATFNPAKISYCATSPDYRFPSDDPFAPPPPGNGSFPPNNPNIVLRSMADGWLNYGFNFKLGLYFPVPPQTDNSTVYPGNGMDIFNDLADAGGYVLPFSYYQPLKGTPLHDHYPANVAAMSGTAANPKFSFMSYNSTDVAAGDPQLGNPPVLNFEIASIHKVFPNVPIIIIGHSNGGLIAEQWWLRFGTKNNCGDVPGLSGQPQCGMHGVTHVFTLDSPINGVSEADLCDNGFSPDLGGYVTGQAVNDLCSGAMGTKEASEYAGMYKGNVTDMVPGLNTYPPDPGEGDPLIRFLDTSFVQVPKLPPGAPPQLSQLIPQGFHTQPGTFTAVGTYGDPLYDAGDPSIAVQHLGILSQMVFSLQCLKGPDLAASECAPLKGIGSSTVPPLDWVSPCAGSYDSSAKTSYSNEADRNYPVYLGGLGGLPLVLPPGIPLLLQTYGLPGSLYIHSQAKDCPRTIDMIVNYAKTLQPTLPPTPPVNLRVAWLATASDPSNTVGAALRKLETEMPVLDAIQKIELFQLSTIPLGDLDEDPPAQAAEGQEDIAALNRFFNTPGFSPGG